MTDQDTHTTIDRLTERYFAGLTSLEEERTLRCLLARDGSIEHSPQRATMAYTAMMRRQSSRPHTALRRAMSIAAATATAVSADIASATDREVSYHDGRIKYAFLTMPTADDGLNRYVIYVCNPAKSGRRRVLLIDIKGKATARQLQNLIKITSK